MQPKSPHLAFSINWSSQQRHLETGCGVQNYFLSSSGFQSGYAIWDTGATASAISPQMAKLLKLVAIDKNIVRGIHSEEAVNVYVVNFLLPNNVVLGPVSVNEVSLGGNVDVLIGMDIIGAGDFAICGGKFFSFAFPSFENPIDFVEKSEKVNKKIMKHDSKC